MSDLYTFPAEFLKKSAIEHNLSEPESAVFSLRFSSGLENIRIMQELHISQDALHKRYRSIYEKYSIQRRGKGREQYLIKQLDSDFELFKQKKARELGLLELEKETEKSSLKAEMARMWQEMDRLRNDIDGTTQLRDSSEVIAASESIDVFIDRYIEKLWDRESSPSKVLNEFLKHVPAVVETLSLQPGVTERGISVSLLKCFKRFVRRVESKKIEKESLESSLHSDEELLDSI